MKKIVCKSPEDYNNHKDELLGQGFQQTGNSYTCSLFINNKTGEEVLLLCPYVKF